jgi:hypothetical protein
MSKNDITGANLQTKAATDNYRSGWDLIYANKKSNEDSAKAETEQPINIKNIYMKALIIVAILIRHLPSQPEHHFRPEKWRLQKHT